MGRLPVIASLNALKREDLVRILTEPKNALVKQYKKLMEYDEVELEFQPEALEPSPTRPSSGTSAPGACGPSWRVS